MTHCQHHRTTTLLFALCLAATVGCSIEQPAPSCPVDSGTIKAADLEYAKAWLANDIEQVMATLTDNATIVPSGIPAMQGAEEIRRFWWPPDSPATTVSRFDLVQHETTADRHLAFVRGSFMLSFLYDGKSYASTGDYISILQCQTGGSWRISHRQWNDHPPPTD